MLCAATFVVCRGSEVGKTFGSDHSLSLYHIMSRSMLSDLPSSGLLLSGGVHGPAVLLINHCPKQIQISDEPPVLVETDATHMLVRSLKIRREKELERSALKRHADAKSGSSPASKKQALSSTPAAARFSKRATRLQEAALQPVSNVPDSARRMRRRRTPASAQDSSD
ncbi:hypothetical protein BVRB_024650 [Beta vulgaris subsp. vulgaris]|uniref:DET1- and DDB1-associated protein 1 n=1 Tax=Beta vulgaris subsp. vulgaris TaxID=3555 RepID=A0A0J8DTK9_BETVV|nr:hypothetical protein BVRB_024650 [Beta vulgaris subsp. vulgaris]